jgi:hypothetical protein
MHATTADAMHNAAKLIVAKLHAGFRRVCSCNAFSDLHVNSIEASHDVLYVSVCSRDKTCARDINLRFNICGTAKNAFVGAVFMHDKAIVINRALYVNSTSLEFIAIGSIIGQHVMREHCFYYAISRLRTFSDPAGVIDSSVLSNTGITLAWNGSRGSAVLSTDSLSIKTAIGITRIEMSREALTAPVQDIRQQIRNAIH